MKIASHILRAIKVFAPLYRLQRDWDARPKEDIRADIYQIYAAWNLPPFSSSMVPTFSARFAFLFYKIHDANSCIKASVATMNALENSDSKFFKKYTDDEKFYLICYVKYLMTWFRPDICTIDEVKSLFERVNIEKIKQKYRNDFPLNPQYLSV